MMTKRFKVGDHVTWNSEADRGISPAKVRAFESCMNTLKKPVDVEIYGGAGHAFENPANKNAYRPEAAADAWLRTLKFFDKAKGTKFSIS